MLKQVAERFLLVLSQFYLQSIRCVFWSRVFLSRQYNAQIKLPYCGWLLIYNALIPVQTPRVRNRDIRRNRLWLLCLSPVTVKLLVLWCFAVQRIKFRLHGNWGSGLYYTLSLLLKIGIFSDFSSQDYYFGPTPDLLGACCKLLSTLIAKQQHCQRVANWESELQVN